MKRVIVASLTTVVSLVLLLSFKTHGRSAVTAPPAAVNGAGATGAGAADPSSGPAASGGSTDGTSGTTSGAAPSRTAGVTARTYQGAEAMTPYGPVQVEITVKSGKVVAASATEYPEESPRDAEINAYAIPALNAEAGRAGSSTIDMISGATYTSQGYIASLQSALDKAGL